MAWDIVQKSNSAVRIQFDDARFIEFGIATDTDQTYIALQTKAGTTTYIGTSSGAAVSASTTLSSL